MLEMVNLPTEILHSILLPLPTKDLLLARRICRQWQTVINKSTSLQQALFLHPRAPEVYWKYTYYHDEAQPSNPEHRDRIDPTSQPGIDLDSIGFHDVCADPPITTKQREVFTKVRIGMEPFTKDQMTASMYGDPVMDNKKFMQRRCILGEHNPLLLTLDSSFSIWNIMKETGSSFLRFHERCADRETCTEMFLTQPPAKRLTYTWRFERSPDDYLWSSGELTNESGLRMADIMKEVDCLEAALEKKIAWVGSHIVIDGPICPSEEQEREYEKDMDVEDTESC